jgi:hypothetical protein
MARYSSSRRIVASSATAATIISRPSSLGPSENTRTRGDASATARKYA